MGHHFFRWCEQCFGGGAILDNNHVINPNNLLINPNNLLIFPNNLLINPNNLLIFPDSLCNLDGFVGTTLPLIYPLIVFVGSGVRYVIDKLKSPCLRQGITTCLAGRGPSAKGEHWLR